MSKHDEWSGHWDNIAGSANDESFDDSIESFDDVAKQSGFVDDRDQQATLDIGGDAARTQRRAGRESDIAGSSAFVDDSAMAQGQQGQQSSLFGTQEELEGQQDLFGGTATVEETAEWEETGNGNGGFDLFGRSAPTPTEEIQEIDVNGERRDARAFEGTGLSPEDFERHEPEPQAPRDEPVDILARDLDLERRMDAADDAGVLDPVGPNGDEEHAPEDVFERMGRQTETIEFGSRDAAQRARKNLDDDAVVTERYDGRHKTVEIDVTQADDRTVDRVAGMAADSRAYEAEQHGQIELTDRERDQIDFRQTNVPHARAAKGVLTGKGIDDWQAFYDPTLTVDEHRSIAQQARQDDRGDRFDEEATEAAQIGRLAGAHQQAMAEECDHARDGCKDGVDEACQVLRTQCDMSEAEIQRLRGQVERGEITEAEFRRRVAVELERSAVSGQMVTTDTMQTTFPPGERARPSGQFVPSEENRLPPGIKRDVRTGKFVPESGN